MPQTTGAAIFHRMVDSRTITLPQAAAQLFLTLDFHPTDHQRMADLSEKAQEGALSRKERAELEEYLRVADLLAVLQSRARRSLKTKTT